MIVTLPEETICLRSQDNVKSICLNLERHRKVPDGYNIHGILVDFPENLDSIQICIGNSVLAVFTSSMKSELAIFPIYLELSRYMYTHIEFVYNKEWLRQNETILSDDEYIEQIEYDDEEQEIFDGHEYHVGRVVSRKQVPTGNKLRGPAKVTLPKVTMLCERNDLDTDTIVEVPVLEKVKNMDETYRRYLETNRGLNADEYAINVIVYRSGMAGLKYVF